MNNKNTMHIMMQSKGGVGKSVFSAILSQYLNKNTEYLEIMSTGPVHHTLANYKTLNVKKIKTLRKDHAVDQSKFDIIFNRFFESLSDDSATVVLDTSSNDHLPFNDYAVNLKLQEVFSEEDKRLVIHCPIVYGQSQQETIDGLLKITQDYPGVPIVIWENEFFGKSRNSFIDQSIFNKESNVVGAVKVEGVYYDMATQTFSKMLNKFMTFDEVASCAHFDATEKETLAGIKNNIWAQLDIIFNEK